MVKSHKATYNQNYLGAGYGELMGFYPVFSNINHSCISNSKVIKDKTSLKVEVRAKRDIKVLNLNK